MEYRLIRSRRRTLCAEITEEGLLVRAPMKTPLPEIDAFLKTKEKWIEKTLAKVKAQREAVGDFSPLSPAEIRGLAEKAASVVPERVAYYAEKIGVSYGKITVRNQKTRYGSCSSKGNLSFNLVLMLMPPAVRDSIIVHELCHRKQMNHSAAFYREINRVFPEYGACKKWLDENGKILLLRMQKVKNTEE